MIETLLKYNTAPAEQSRTVSQLVLGENQDWKQQCLRIRKGLRGMLSCKYTGDHAEIVLLIRSRMLGCSGRTPIPSSALNRHPTTQALKLVTPEPYARNGSPKAKLASPTPEIRPKQKNKQTLKVGPEVRIHAAPSWCHLPQPAGLGGACQDVIIRFYSMCNTSIRV